MLKLLCLTIIPQVCLEYEMINSQRGAELLSSHVEQVRVESSDFTLQERLESSFIKLSHYFLGIDGIFGS